MNTNKMTAALAVLVLACGALGCGDDDSANPAGTGGDAAIDSGGTGGDAAVNDSGDDDAQVAGFGGAGGNGGAAGSAGNPPPCPDSDGDGHRAASCGGDDCDDTNNAVHPGVIELCDNHVDDDCSYATSDRPDLDGDGFDCIADCDDDERTINPGRLEVCGNGIDDDCSLTTEDVRDLDNDGFSCDVDCDETRASVNPAADELCGTSIDEDCDPNTSDTGDNDADGVDCTYDCDDNNANLPDSSHYCAGTFSYFEGFERDAGGWTVSGVNASWQRGTPNGDFIDRAATGQFAWVTGIDPSGYRNDEVSFLTSPAFDFSGLSEDPVFRFARTFKTEASYDVVVVELSTDGGDQWYRLPASAIDQNLYADDEPGFSGESAWLPTVMRLTGAAGESDVRIRFAMGSDYSLFYDGFGLDNVRITEQILDLSLDTVVLPEARCADRTAEAITVTVTNRSSTAIDSFDVAYSVNGGDPITESFNDSLAPDTSLDITLAATANLASPGRHVVRAWVTLPTGGDEDRSNDAAEAVTYAFAQAGAPDYVEGFEASGGGWTPMGVAPSWARGTPIGDPIDGAGEGNIAWKTNPYGVHNANEDSVLASPCFNFSALSDDPVLSFLHAYSTSYYDAHTVEIAIDGGAFQKLGTSASAGAAHWYNDADEDVWNEQSAERGVWLRAHHPLTGTAGASQVQLRFTLTTTGYQRGGAGIDDVRILSDFVDPQLSAPALPTVGCAGARPAVAVEIFNGGNHPLSDFEVSYTLDDGTPVVETVVGPIAPLATSTHTFANAPLLSTEGPHTLTIRCNADGQIDSELTRITHTLTVQRTVSAQGYRESFETDAAGWSSGGEHPWVRGRPLPWLADVITGAADGEYAWRTNLRDEYADNTESYLLSPCFDFTSFSAQPQVELAQIRDTERNYDGAWLEVSTDSGATFTKVGQSGAGTNWYNNATDQWWDGSSTAGTWLTARARMSGVATQSNVVFRIAFTSDSSSGGEGVGIDNFAIVP